METENHYFKVGLFFLVAIGGMFYYLMTFNSGKSVDDYLRYAIYFDHSVTGLSRGAPVKLKGIEVGSVKSIGFDSYENNHIEVLVDIVDTAPVREDTFASLEFQGITGSSYISLENKEAEGKPVYLSLKEGQEYMVIQSEKSSLQVVLSSAPQVMGQIVLVAEEIKKIIPSFQKTLDSFDETLKKFNGTLTNADKALLSTSKTLVNTNETFIEGKKALREVKMLARTIREDPSVIIRGTKYEGYKVEK